MMEKGVEVGPGGQVKQLWVALVALLLQVMDLHGVSRGDMKLAGACKPYANYRVWEEDCCPQAEIWNGSVPVSAPFKTIYLLCVCVRESVASFTTTLMWRSRDKSWEFILSFHPVVTQ